jgi:Mrp family chromosome partitioning ATPase
MPNTSGVAKLGLTDLLIGRVPVTQLIQTDPNTKIDYIPAGAAMVRPFGPEEIARFQEAIAILKQSYSLIVIDSPPLLAMTDALVYGSIADQTILVCRWQQTSRMAVNASLDRLRAYGARIAGLVVTMADENSTLAVGGEYGKRETQMLSRLYGYGG